MRRGNRVRRILLCLLFLTPGLALAQGWASPLGEMEGGRIKLGKLKVIPELEVGEFYHDNIYLGNGTDQPNEQEVSDWLTGIKPGLTLNYDLPGARGNAQIGYEGYLAYYADENQNDWQNHSGFFNLNYKSPGGLIVQLNEKYTDAEDPYGSPEQYALGRPKTERWTNDLKSVFGYEFSHRFRVLGRYNYYKQDYDLLLDFTQDYDVQEFGGGVQVRVLPKTWAFLRYLYGEQDYFTHPLGIGVTGENDADRSWSDLSVGLTWDSGAKLSGKILFGYAWYDFDNTLDPTGRAYEDKDTWVARTDVQYHPRETTRIGLSVFRVVRTSGAASGEFFEDTSVRVGIRQGFLRKFFAVANLRYSLNDYNRPLLNTREDDNYEAEFKLGYLLKDWIKAEVGYMRMEKDSNYDQNDYTANMYGISLTVKY